MDNELPLDILDSLSEGVITIDKEFIITYINLSALKMIKMEKSKVIGKLCEDVFKPKFCKDECPILRVLQNGKSIYNFESTIISNSNKEIPIKLNATVLKDKNNIPTGGVLSFRDILRGENSNEILDDISQFHGLIGGSKKMRELYSLINEMSYSDAPVLIQGETGTGKELLANAIQETSIRNRSPFLKINCAVLMKDLLASELFGHIKGAFTSADRDRIGRFELANNGTIFLDEISEMPIQMQTHLLRILQEGTFERVGDSKTRYTDVRIIAASNINLEEAVKNKTFREDLFYRINVIPLTIPPLRERLEDIPLLVNHFINKFSLKYKKPIEGIDDDALSILASYNWPGNIRQLENSIEYAFIRSKRNFSICACALPKYLREKQGCNENKFPQKHHKYISKTVLLDLLNKNNWNKSLVADLLGVDRTTIWRKIKKFNLDK